MAFSFLRKHSDFMEETMDKLKAGARGIKQIRERGNHEWPMAKVIFHADKKLKARAYSKTHPKEEVEPCLRKVVPLMEDLKYMNEGFLTSEGDVEDVIDELDLDEETLYSHGSPLDELWVAPPSGTSKKHKKTKKRKNTNDHETQEPVGLVNHLPELTQVFDDLDFDLVLGLEEPDNTENKENPANNGTLENDEDEDEDDSQGQIKRRKICNSN